MIAVSLVLAVAAMSPETVDALSRAAAVSAAENPRFDVVSELDMKDMVDFEVQRQTCGATAESCASQLAGAYDARLVLFLNLYAVGDELHAQVTLRDLKAEAVIARDDTAGPDEKALFAAVKAATAGAVSRFVDFPATGRTRLFVARASSGIATTAAPAPPAPPSAGLMGPGIAAAGGAVVGVAGLVVGLVSNGVVADETALRDAKDGAQVMRSLGYVGAGIGLAVCIGGVALGAVSMLSEGDT